MKKIIDKQEAIEAVEKDGMRLEECSDELKNDRDVVIGAIRNCEEAMMFVSEKLQCDRDIIEMTLLRYRTDRQGEGIGFSFVPDHIKDNDEMALIAISIYTQPFEYFSDRLKHDKKFLVRAMAKNYGILKYLDNKYAEDKTFIKKVLNDKSVRTILNKKSFARDLDASILDSAYMMKEIIEKADFENFRYASDRLKKDKFFLIEILSIAPQIYKFLYNFYDDKDVTLAAVRVEGMNLQRASLRLKENKNLVLEAVKNNPHSIQFADESLQEDKELWSYVTKDNNYYCNLVNPRNGLRYDIPMLMSNDPMYYIKYIDYMKMKEQSPDTFEKMLRWD